MNKSNKTNAMRLMDAAKIPYRAVEYEYDGSDLGGEHVAAVTGMNPDQVFKTLVARGDEKGDPCILHTRQLHPGSQKGGACGR